MKAPYQIKTADEFKTARKLYKREKRGEVTIADWLSTPNSVIKKFFMITEQKG
jgi:hypothetical protein